MKRDKNSNFLDSLIKILVVFLLLGVISIVGLYIKKMISSQNQTLEISAPKKIENTSSNNSNLSINESTNSSVVEEKVEDTQSKPSKTKQKLYTEEEMQEILQMMIDQMQELNEEESNGSSSVNSNEDLTQTLQEIESDQDSATNNLPKELDADKIEAKNSSTKDTYNKVVVGNGSYSNNNINKLSKEIDSLVQKVQTNSNDSSSYTNNIKKEVKVREDSMRIIIVKRGDTLSKIALRAYGNIDAYTKILEANRDLIKNPNRIYVGQRLRIPNL